MTIVTKQEPINVKVKNFLKGLGSGPNKIAENLKEMKVKGRMGDIENCVLVKALRKNFKGVRNICVDGNEATFTYKGKDYCVDMPSACTKFIEKFDEGDYPDIAIKAKEVECG